MAYEKNTWNAGDVITSEKLNHIEDGIVNAGGASMMSVTYAELLAMRNVGALTPGMQYRITDYVCTTTQEESRAVSHPFDIIVTADGTDTLNENARTVKKDSDTYYQHANLSAWKLKYCLDNDTDRFKWADTTNGHGVVYYMKDDHNNECPYDFKQMQFKRYPITTCTISSLVGKYTTLQHGNAITGINEQNSVWCYTFSYDPESTGIMSDASVMEFTGDNEANISLNIIKTFYNYQDPDEWVGFKVAYLNNIVLIGNNCYSNTFGDYCQSNTFGNYCYFNTFEDCCESNTFGNNCISNTFGNYCQSNTFGDGYQSNMIKNNYTSNTFGDYCQSNTFGDYCNSNTFGNNCEYNIFGDYCESNTLGDECNYIDISAGTSQQRKRYYHVLDRVRGTSSSHFSIVGTGGNNFVTYVGKNSSDVLKTWIPADMVQ